MLNYLPLNLDDLNLTLWNDKCDYINPESCTNLNLENYNLLILQHNIRGLIGNQDDLKLFLGILQARNSPVDIILLCETFLNNITVGLVNISGYDIISNHQQEYKEVEPLLLSNEEYLIRGVWIWI